MTEKMKFYVEIKSLLFPNKKALFHLSVTQNTKEPKDKT
jgi:hypothetical protein